MPPPQRRRRSPEVYAQRAFSRPLHWRQQASYAGATARPDRSQCNLLDTPGLYAVYTPRTAIERAGAAVILRSLVRILEAIDYLRFLPRGGCRGRSALRPARRTRRVNVTMLEWLATDASVEFADVSARHGAPPAATARSGDRSGHDHSRQPNGTLIRGGIGKWREWPVPHGDAQRKYWRVAGRVLGERLVYQRADLGWSMRFDVLPRPACRNPGWTVGNVQSPRPGGIAFRGFPCLWSRCRATG